MEHSEGLYRLARVYRPFRTPNDTHAAPKGQNTTGMGVVHSAISGWGFKTYNTIVGL